MSWRAARPGRHLNASDLIAAFLQRSPASALNLAKGTNAIPAGGTFDGFDRFAVTNLSVGATQIFPKQLGAERVVLTGEVGYNNVAGLPMLGRCVTVARMILDWRRSVDKPAWTTRLQNCSAPSQAS